MYANIPTEELIIILHNKLKISCTEMGGKELVDLCRILKQYVFTFDGNLFVKDGGLAMGALSSLFLRDLFVVL
jgi:hypothetical protein